MHLTNQTRGSGLIDKPPREGEASLLRIGRIIAVHGLRGGVRFRPDNPDSQSVHTLERIFLADENAQSSAALKSREYRIDKVTPLGRGTIRLMLEGIADVDHAEALKHKTVFADLRDLPPPEPHEFYYHEAVGCEVVLVDGRRIGTIEEVFSAGANDVFIVRDGSKEVLVPVIADVVKTIDIAGRRVTIEAVPGLLD